MRSWILRLLVPAVAVALTASILSVAPASAASTRGDGRDAAAPIDTRRVVLYPSLRREVVVELSSPTYRAGRRFNGLDIRYDTTGNGVGDYRLLWGFNKDGDGYTEFRLYRARGNRLVRPVRCLDYRARSYRRGGQIVIRVVVPRRCLTMTKKLGVAVTTWNWTSYRKDRFPRRGRLDRTPNRKSAFLR